MSPLASARRTVSSCALRMTPRVCSRAMSSPKGVGVEHRQPIGLAEARGRLTDYIGRELVETPASVLVWHATSEFSRHGEPRCSAASGARRQTRRMKACAHAHPSAAVAFPFLLPPGVLLVAVCVSADPGTESGDRVGPTNQASASTIRVFSCGKRRQRFPNPYSGSCQGTLSLEWPSGDDES